MDRRGSILVQPLPRLPPAAADELRHRLVLQGLHDREWPRRLDLRPRLVDDRRAARRQQCRGRVLRLTLAVARRASHLITARRGSGSARRSRQLVLGLLEASRRVSTYSPAAGPKAWRPILGLTI